MAEIKVMGLFLIIIAFIIFIYAVPTLNENVKTTSGTPLENETKTIKDIYSIYGLMIAIIPAFIFIVGAGLIWKG